MVKYALSSFVVSLVLSFAVQAQESTQKDQLQDVEKSLQQELEQSQNLNAKAAILEQDLNKINAQLINAARTVQEHETAVISLEDQLVILKFEEIKKVKLLNDQRVQFSKVLMALERMARFPPEALIAQPGDPGDTVRSAILLRSVVPEIEKRAEALRQKIESLAKSRVQLKAQQIALATESRLLDKQSEHLTDLLVRKKKLKVQTDADRTIVTQRAAQLAREAENLRDLMAQLRIDQQDRENALAQTTMVLAPQKPEASPELEIEFDLKIESEPDSNETLTASLSVGVLSGIPFSTQQGKMPFPVVGKIISRYGQANANGVTERGIKLITRPSAQVIAPYEGHVAFVGEFRGYGQLLIIEHSEGYHTLLAGMSRIDSIMGQKVLIGEPVGIMDSSSDAKPVLYVELRRQGKPVNPLPWLAQRGSSTQG